MRHNKKNNIIIVAAIILVPICIVILASTINLIRYGSISKPIELRTSNNHSSIAANENKLVGEKTNDISNDLSYIKVKITGTDGKEYYLDKGILKDKISFSQDIYVDVCNMSQDSKFTGTIFFNGASILDQYGTLEILPGQSQQLKVVFNKDDFSYTLKGEMKKVVNEESINKYNVLGSKTRNTLSGQAIYCGIEIPDDFSLEAGEEILKDFISSYSGEMTVEMLTVYVYDKGYTMSTTEDMYKNSVYELDTYLKEDGSYTFDCYESK